MKERSYLPIKIKHLNHLGKIVLSDQKSFFLRKPKYAPYKNEMKAILLVQGAALHYADGKNGIKDFDLLVAYQKLNDTENRIYPKRIKSYNSNLPEFGRYPKDNEKYKTRRVDILMREIKFSKDKHLSENLHDYIASHNYWSKKAAIGIWPRNILGKIIYHRAN